MDRYTGTKTERNLRDALLGEAAMREKYEGLAGAERHEADFTMEDAFRQAAGSGKEHGSAWYRELRGCGAEGQDALREAEEEFRLWSEVYSAYEETARSEGFAGLAARFRIIAEIEKRYADCFRDAGKLWKELTEPSDVETCVWEAWKERIV